MIEQIGPGAKAFARVAEEAAQRLALETFESVRMTTSAGGLGNVSRTIERVLGFSVDKDLPLLEGGSISLSTNGLATLSRSKFLEPDRMSYRAVASNSFVLYKPSDRPAEISATIMRGYICPVGSDGTPTAWVQPNLHDWSKLDLGHKEVLERIVPELSVPAGAGLRRQAWLLPGDDVVVYGPKEYRWTNPGILQPRRNEILDHSQIEWFPYADAHEVTETDVTEFNKAVAKIKGGWTSEDNELHNYGRTRDGKLWRLDPDQIVPNEYESA